MKTTLNIHDALLYEAKAFALLQRTTLTRLIEEGLRLRLQPKPPATGDATQPIQLPLLPAKQGQGMNPNINALSNQSIYDAADGLPL